ncbi:hypothetical protein HPB50_009311 [Hyalomma asiaticum]|uniref:Uncharacterized protein n=1 Tax=Hyalomma asiaticum TaxID=266040 RepID=A0ACB7TH32_HYAAI|nr:hypothetical protein HPB50_009311 [Hyalomma asiaticum]
MGIEDVYESSTAKSVDHFGRTTRKSNSRYSVALPWKEECKHLIGDNRDIAVIRLQKLVRRNTQDFPPEVPMVDPGSQASECALHLVRRRTGQPGH